MDGPGEAVGRGGRRVRVGPGGADEPVGVAVSVEVAGADPVVAVDGADESELHPVSTRRVTQIVMMPERTCHLHRLSPRQLGALSVTAGAFVRDGRVDAP